MERLYHSTRSVRRTSAGCCRLADALASHYQPRSFLSTGAERPGVVQIRISFSRSLPDLSLSWAGPYFTRRGSASTRCSRSRGCCSRYASTGCLTLVPPLESSATGSSPASYYPDLASRVGHHSLCLFTAVIRWVFIRIILDDAHPRSLLRTSTPVRAVLVLLVRCASLASVCLPPALLRHIISNSLPGSASYIHTSPGPDSAPHARVYLAHSTSTGHIISTPSRGSAIPSGMHNSLLIDIHLSSHSPPFIH